MQKKKKKLVGKTEGRTSLKKKTVAVPLQGEDDLFLHLVAISGAKELVPATVPRMVLSSQTAKLRATMGCQHLP